MGRILRPCWQALCVWRNELSQSAAQANTFYCDVAKNGKVFSLRDKNGFPAPKGDGGKRSMPFWSTRSRVEKVIATVPDYSKFEVVELDWETFNKNWITGLNKDGLLIGVNWSGQKATGYDVSPINVRDNIEALISKNT